MTLASLFLGAAVFILSFYGIGTAIGGWSGPQGGMSRLRRFSARVEQVAATVVTSFMVAVVVVWLMKTIGFVDLQGMGGELWGIYTVNGSPSANAMIGFGISVAFVLALVGRMILTVPAFTRFVYRLLGGSAWLEEFMKWAEERRRATIAGAMWIISKIQGLFRW